MIPILYEANETAFTTQGLGALADAVSVSVSRVINGKDELTMVYPSTGIRYADLANDRIIFAQPEYKKTSQPYQIYKITKPLNGLVTVYARHVGSQRAAYIPVTPFSAGTLTEAFNNLPSHLVETSPFTFWTNKTVTANFNLTRPSSLGKVLGGMEGSILDVYGGEYEYDGYTIKLWGRRGTDSGVELRYGKNITDIEQSEDFASIITGVVPYWGGLDGTIVTLPEVAVQGQYADTYSFRRTVVKDFSDAFEEQPSEADLRAAAQRYVAQSNLGVPEINLKVSFEHLAQYTGYENLQLLEKLNLGDTVSIFYEPLDVSATARIAKTTYDPLQEKYTSVQIGSVRSSLEQVMHNVSTTAAQIKENIQTNIPSAIAEAVDNATDLITGVNGGYIVIDRDANGKPYQLLIMDTDNKQTATNVIRINKNGIGFSTNGYSGPFTTAWTIDGSFVADFITAGILNAALAKIGVLADAAGKNSWNMATGAFIIKDGSIQIETNSTQDNRIILTYDDGTRHYYLFESPYGIQTSQSDSSWQYLTNVYNNAIGIESYEITNGVASLFYAVSLISSELTFYGRDRLNGRYTRMNLDGYEVHESDGKMGWLNNNGLSFYDANNNLMAHYPANGMNMLVGKKATDGNTYTGRVINLGLVTASEMGISSSASASVVAGAWLAYCVDKYPNAKQCIFEGVALANSYRMMRVMIYDTSDKSGIQPNVASGTMQFYNGDIVVFGANNYNVWTRNVTMSAQVYQ